MHKLLEPYAALVPFLGVALGDNVEVALHDLTSPEQEVVAIANGEISGREVGAKLSNLSVHYLETKQYEKSDYVMNYKTAGPDGKLLKSATYWIKEPGNVCPVGMLCINVNVTDFEYIETAMRRILGIKDNTNVEDKTIKYLSNNEQKVDDILKILKENEVTPICVQDVICDFSKKSVYL